MLVNKIILLTRSPYLSLVRQKRYLVCNNGDRRQPTNELFHPDNEPILRLASIDVFRAITALIYMLFNRGVHSDRYYL